MNETIPDRRDCCAELIATRGELAQARAQLRATEAALHKANHDGDRLRKLLGEARQGIEPIGWLTLTDRGDAADGYHVEVEP